MFTKRMIVHSAVIAAAPLAIRSPAFAGGHDLATELRDRGHYFGIGYSATSRPRVSLE